MTPAADDFQLLDRYARRSDHAAFAELARRYVNLVHTAAVRRVGNRHLAEDVMQAVFVILATKPGSVRTTAPLSAWLLMTVRYAAANALKMERRRHKHEAIASSLAATSGACSANPSDVLVWQEVASELDDAVLKLPGVDRRAILLRYFEQRPVREVAEALNVTEGAAKQRLNRAVEKLRQRLNRRGATFAPAGAAGLATLLSANAVGAAPAGLVTSAAALSTSAAATAAASVTIAKGAITMMTWTKLKAAALVVAAASIVGTGTAVTINRVSAQNASSVPGASPAVRAAAANRVAAAEKVIALLEQRLAAGEPYTPEFTALIATAHRNLAAARIDAADNTAARVRAAEQYVQQCHDALAILERRRGQDITAVGVAQGAYHLADAEYLLATLQAAR
jgi:RNA polymerase sigma factor (sigma-70 family)